MRRTCPKPPSFSARRDSRSAMILQQERSGLDFKVDKDEIAAILRDNANR